MKKIIMLLVLIMSMAVTGCGNDSEVVEVEEKVDSFADGSDWGDLKGEIVGVSDKNFVDVTNAKPYNVRGDDSGKRKKLVMSKGIDMEEYAVSYYDTYMEEDETHYIINFGRNTTASITHMGGTLYVNIMEYVDKEEHDIKKIGSGMVLQTFRIYPDRDIGIVDLED